MVWNEVLDVALRAILIPLLPLLGLWFSTWLNAQIKALKAKNEREYFNYHLGKVNELIQDVVTEVQQVYVDGLKEEDVFTAEKQKEMLYLAKDKILHQLTVQATDVLEKTYSDYLLWIETLIVLVVNESK